MQKIALLTAALGAVSWGRAALPNSFEPNRGQSPAGTDFLRLNTR